MEWMQTYTGKVFHPFDPKPEQIDIIDIAHSLALQNRYAGHTKKPYSVAQHCLLVSRHVPRPLALAGLLHDASEAYLVDVPRPLKARLGDYRVIESRIMRVIAHKFGFEYPLPEEVKAVDDKIFVDERRHLLVRTKHTNEEWSGGIGEGLGIDHIEPLDWLSAKGRFLERFWGLTS